MAAEIDNPTGAVTRRFVHGPGADEALVQYEGPGTNARRWLHADERGSIIALSDAAGTMVATNAYDEYGVPRSGNVGRLQYTGQAWLPELGIYYYKARMYSPALGRFLQTDPIGYADGMNWYGYVGGDPVNFNDPTGLLCADGSSGGNATDCAAHGGYLAGTPYSEPDGPDIPVNGTACRSTDGCYTSIDDTGRNIITIPGVEPFEALPGDIVVVAKKKPQRQQPSVICRITNSVFNGGKGTLQLGVAGTGQLGPGAGTGGAGFAVDRQGNIGVYSFIGYGAGLGAYLGAGGSAQISNAKGIDNLSGGFANASGSGGIGGSASADVFTGPSAGGPVAGGGVTLGGGAGLGGFAGATFTGVASLFNIKSALGCQ